MGITIHFAAPLEPVVRTANVDPFKAVLARAYAFLQIPIPDINVGNVPEKTPNRVHLHEVGGYRRFSLSIIECECWGADDSSVFWKAPGVVALLSVVSALAYLLIPAGLPDVPAAVTTASPASLHDSEPSKPETHRRNPLLASLHIPWAGGGVYRAPDGSLTTDPEPWPAHRVPAVRLWDTGTTWAQIERADDAWDWGRLDAQVAAAEEHGTTDIMLVLHGTPTWASTDTSGGDAPWLPVGSASPPQDLHQWTDFVGAVVDRYAGRITAYQLWNEPNERWFWKSTPEELRKLLAAAVPVIRARDPHALIVAPGPYVSTERSVDGARRWVAIASGLDIDALAVQWYPQLGTSPRVLATVLQRTRAIATEEGSDPGLALWVTEVNLVKPPNATAKKQRQFVRGTARAAHEAGASRMYWYAWTTRARPELLELQDGSPAGRALARAARELPR